MNSSNLMSVFRNTRFFPYNAQPSRLVEPSNSTPSVKFAGKALVGLEAPVRESQYAPGRPFPACDPPLFPPGYNPAPRTRASHWLGGYWMCRRSLFNWGADAPRDSSSISRKRSISWRPKGVSSAPPPARPPVDAETTASRKQSFRSSTISQACRYAMFMARAAPDMEPDCSIASRSWIFPGPILCPPR